MSMEDKQAGFICEAIARVVMADTGITHYQILMPARGNTPIYRARQAIHYLAAVEYSVPNSLVGWLFHRDRTTIGHNCRRVEDLRDSPDFERRLIIFKRNIDERLQTAHQPRHWLRFFGFPPDEGQ